jgi:hypothetical protein
MNKFPEDVKTAEILTNGDPYILLNKKFNPKEKPDISGLFGEKKIIKKKRNRDDYVKKVDDIRQRVTHPRFIQESDHEVRIRQQPKTSPLTPNSYSSIGIYPCHVCGFTTTRVNVIICHLKNHRINNEMERTIRSKTKLNMQLKQKHANLDSPKRKYIRKLVSCKIKNDNTMESVKRKYCKQTEKPIKKKKSDPELREKLLADWNVDTDEDEPLYFEKSLSNCSVNLSDKKLSYLENTDETNVLKFESDKNKSDSIMLLRASNKLLKETDSFTDLSILEKEKDSFDKINPEQNNMKKSPQNVANIIENSFLTDDKKSKLSCFDFDEDDVPEPSISSVRKIPRSLGSKNLSIKKEIIKEFQMSQALKIDEEALNKTDEIKLNVKINNKFTIVEEKVQITQDIKDNKALKKDDNIRCQNWSKNNEDEFKKSEEICETHLEIVEILEVEKENLERKIKKDEEQREFEKEIQIKNDHLSEFNIQEYIKLKTNEEAIDTNVPKNNVSLGTLQEEKIEFDSFHKNISKEIKKNECKEVILLEKEINSLHTQHFIKNNISNKISISEAKIETNVSIDCISENQNKPDIEISSNFNSNLQGLLEGEDKNDTIEDNLNLTNKKQCGRSKKKKTFFEDFLSDNEDLKSNNNKKKSECVQKMSVLDLDRSCSIKKQKFNKKKDSPLHLFSFNHKSLKCNENLSESDDNVEETNKKMEKNVKLESNEAKTKLINKIQNSNSLLNNTNKSSVIEDDIKKDTVNNTSKIINSIEEQSDILVTIDILEQCKDDISVKNKNDSEKSIYDNFTGNYNNIKVEKKMYDK